ncbi:hypothetical protein KM043_015643 [Ampulex compressa]|nr:hypothetical protein KM043_015643 [Ampulex compressa]
MDHSEVICISSDEDDAMQEENKNNPSSTEHNDLLFKCTKEEILSNGDEQKNDNSNKRKASQMDSENKSPVDKKIKCTIGKMKCDASSNSVVNNVVKLKRVVLNLQNDVTVGPCTTFDANKNIQRSVSFSQNTKDTLDGKDNVAKTKNSGEINKQREKPVLLLQVVNQASDKIGSSLSSTEKSILCAKSLRDVRKNIVKPCSSTVSPAHDIIKDKLGSHVNIAELCPTINNDHDYVEDKQASYENCQIKKKSIVKPKLIIKEKRSIFQEEQDVFPMFISLCLQKDHTEDMKKIVSKLKRRYEQLDPAYARSEAFKNFLNEKRNDIMNSSKKLFIHIMEVMTEMRNKRKNKSQLAVNGRNHIMNVSNSTASTSYKSGTNISTSNYNEHEEDQFEDSVLERKLRPILKAMEKCERYIKKLEEAEVDFDDENNSNYMRLEKFKLKMVELYNKYCEYTGENPDAGRPYLRPKHINTTSIVTVDQAIISFINSKISRRNKLKRIGALPDAVIFPDYTDILQCVTRCNDLHNLGLDKKKQQEMAKKAFTELGQYLQRCRRNDYWDTFSLFLENKEDDPALKDPALAERLRKNRVEGEKKLSNIFQEYVKKQEEMKDQQSNTKTLSDEEGDEDNSMDNEDEDEDEEEDNSCNEESISVDTNKLSIDKDKMNKDEDKLSTVDDSINVQMSKSNTNDDEISIEKTETGEIIIESKRGKKGNDDRPQVDDRLSSSTDNDLTLDKTDDTVTKKDITSNPTTELNNQILSPPLGSRTTNRTEEDVAVIVSGDRKHDAESEGEKPLLRVRSFAKPPTTWEDGKQKTEPASETMKTSKDLAKETIVDLTKESPKQDNHASSTMLQNGSNPRPAAKAGQGLTLVPRVAGVNGGQAQMIRLPLTTDQRTVSGRSAVTNIQLNRNDTTVLQIIQPSPTILIHTTQLGQNVSKSLTTDSSTTIRK